MLGVAWDCSVLQMRGFLLPPLLPQIVLSSSATSCPCARDHSEKHILSPTQVEICHNNLSFLRVI